MTKYPLLDTINTPEDVRNLSQAQLPALCGEIRAYLVEVVSQNGGHLASNLGVVELTVALHRVFNPPSDPIVFDVGHQCYTHKILTGRRREFASLRKKDGLSGFPKSSESIYDAFLAGHASTAISAAYGICEAKRLNNDPGTTVAVVGDGALTGGEAYEGLNNAGRRHDAPFVVVLNDNERSISRNVGALAGYLAALRSKPGYFRAKDRVQRILRHVPLVGRPIARVMERTKAYLRKLVTSSTFFEDLGFVYLGPIDGHDLPMLIAVLERAKKLACPVLVHVITKKGKGYPPAEENPGAFHGTAPFCIETGDVLAPSRGPSFSEVFGNTLVQLAETRPEICAITAAMKFSTGLSPFQDRYPQRFFDVGIAEAHAVTFAAGLSSKGMKPVFCVYSTFLQRTLDQLIHDVAIENQFLILGVDRAGVVGEDGETHQGLFDVSLLRMIPGITIYSPASEHEIEPVLRRALSHESGIHAIRYPRGGEPDPPCPETLLCEDYRLDRTGKDHKVLLVCYGRISGAVCKAACRLRQGGRSADVLKLTQIYPLPAAAVREAAAYEAIYFFEESIRQGGIAEEFLLQLQACDFKGRYHITAVEGRFIKAASVRETLRELGLDCESVEAACSKGESM